MPTPRELKKARRDAQRAALTVELIEALPRRRGALYKGWSNGLVWQRVGDDAWVPLHDGEDTTLYRPYPSAHVATHAESLLPRRLL